MARGIDAFAHRAALDSGGTSIGVLGSGLDYEFPSSNRPLYRQMRQRGLLVSEFPPDQPPAAGCFPRRNRLIAALAQAVVVIQAGRRSGALITAGHALDLGRDVLAVPGPVGLDASVGVNDLLRDGAGLVTSAEDVLEGLGWTPRDARPESGADTTGALSGLGRPARRILERLDRGSCGVDELAVASKLEPGSALALLSTLELDGWLVSRPGGRFERAGPRPVISGQSVQTA
jgi:DNA processing protein